MWYEVIEISAPWQQSQFLQEEDYSFIIYSGSWSQCLQFTKTKKQEWKTFFNLLNLKRKNDCSESEVTVTPTKEYKRKENTQEMYFVLVCVKFIKQN